MLARTTVNIGRLLRVQAMVTEVAQTEATYKAAGALVRAYLSLRAEVILIMAAEELSDLRGEAMRLFPEIGEPAPFTSAGQPQSHEVLETAATEALSRLRQLGGWIQGLINELTLDQRLRLEAEAKAKLEAHPGTGFQAT
jgi:hypothetical protein